MLRIPRDCLLVPASVVLTLFCGAALAAEGGGVLGRWAIIAAPDLQQTGLADLTTVELTGLEGVSLVEREQLDRALKELDLSALFSAGKPGDRLRLGQLLGADALVLISLQRSEGEEDGIARIGAVAVDCRYGARIGKTWLPWDQNRVDATARELSTFVASLRQRFPRGVETLVGLPDFLSKTFRHDWDHLQGGFAQLVRSGLSGYSGVAVLETEEVHQIVKELNLTGNQTKGGLLPVFVEGEYEILDANEPAAERRVRMTLRMHRPGEPEPQEFRCADMSVQEVSARLSKNVPAAIMQVARRAGGASFSREKQAALLREQARHFASLSMWIEATRLREASLLADPDQAGAHEEICEYYRRVCWVVGGPGPEARRKAERMGQTAHHELLMQLRRGIAYHTEQAILRREVDLPTAWRMMHGIYSDVSVLRNEIPPAMVHEVREPFFWSVAPVILSLPAQPRDILPLYGSRDRHQDRLEAQRVECTRHLIRALWSDNIARYHVTGNARDPQRLSPERFRCTLVQIERLVREVFPDDLPSFAINDGFLPGARTKIGELRKKRLIPEEELLAFIKRLKESDKPAGRALGVKFDEFVTPRSGGHGGPGIYGYRVPSAQQEGRRGAHVRQLDAWEGMPGAQLMRIYRESKGFKPFAIRGITSTVAHTVRPTCVVHGLRAVCEDATIAQTSAGYFFLEEDGRLRTRLPEGTGPANQVVRIVEHAPSGRWWVAQQGQGVFLTDHQGNVLARFDSARGLPPVAGTIIEFNDRSDFELLPVSADRCFALGLYGVDERVWLAALTLEADGSAKVDVLLQTTRRTAENAEDDNLDVRFWLTFPPTIQLFGRGTESPKVIVSRRIQLKGANQPFVSRLVIDARSLALSTDKEGKYAAYFDRLYRLNLLTRSYLADGSLMVVARKRTSAGSPPAVFAETIEHIRWSEAKGDFERRLVAEQPPEIRFLSLATPPQFHFAPGKAWFLKRQFVFEIDMNTWQHRIVDNGEPPELPGKLGTAHHLGLVALDQDRIWKVNLSDGDLHFDQSQALLEKLRVGENRQAAFLDSTVKLARAKIHVGWIKTAYSKALVQVFISRESEVTPETLRWLHDIPKISLLSVFGASLDEPCLETLAETPGLTRLALVRVQLPPARLKMLAKLTELTELALEADNLDAAALDSVPRLPKLKRMSLFGPELTEEDVKRLAGRMPKEAIITWYK